MQGSLAHKVKVVVGFAVLQFLIFMSHLNAQMDTVLQLKQIEVTAQRIDLTDIGKHSDRIDSQVLAGKHHDNLASLLSSQTPLFVRSYGAGTLATLGIRGGGAAHTQILWNGIPLRNPMLGLVDLSLIPSAFIDEASIHYGGHGAAFGSGAVGGLISISNDHVSFTDAIHFKTMVGSWGNRLAQVQLDYGFKKIRFSSRLFAQAAENNFRFRLGKGQSEHNQVHHRLKNHGILQEIFVQLNKNQSLTSRVWYQATARQVPPTSTQSNSKAGQQDKSLRASLQWNHQGKKVDWQLKTAWLDETIDYQDTLILLYTHNQFRTWLAEAETAFRISQQIHITGGVYTEVAHGQSGNYSGVISRNQSAAFSSIRFITKNWNWRFQFREELTQGSLSPLLLDLSAEWSFIKRLMLKSSVSRNYRAPTLNDLHWRPGGNLELTPEKGWTYEGGAQFVLHLEKFQFTSSATAYTRTIDDWIMWMPPIKDLRNYWSPINVAQVKSKGIETRSNMRWSGREWMFTMRFALDLTWSTFATPLEEFKIEAGDQLFYVPIENLLTGFNFKLRDWACFYDHHWFGAATGINDRIEAYNVGSAGLTFHFLKRKLSGSAYLQVDNAWNVPYRVIERRPMPGRSFTGGVKFSFS